MPSSVSGAERHPSGSDAEREEAASAPPVDVQAIADRVYRLMLAEARLDRVRGAARSSSHRG